MTTTDTGRLGEAKIIAALTEQGWYPFIDLSGKSPVDILAWKNQKIISLQVKTTGTQSDSGGWTVQIGAIRPNRTGNRVEKFSAERSDYLGVYIVPVDKVCFIPTSKVTTGRTITLRDQEGPRIVHVIKNYELVIE